MLDVLVTKGGFMRFTKLAGRLLTSSTIGMGLLFGTAISQSAGASNASPIVVGDICSCTGPLGAGALPTTSVLQAWAKWVNAHGGIDHHQVTLVVKDDGSNPSTATADAKELVEENHAVALVDNSITGQAWDGYAQSQHVPVVGLGGPWQKPEYFVPGTTVAYDYIGIAEAAKRVGAKKFAIVVCAEDAICASSKAPTGAALQRLGIRLTYFTTISFAAPNYTAQCLAAQQSGATAVEVGDASFVIQHFMQDCATQGYRPKLAEAVVIYNNWPTIPAFNGAVAMLPTYPWALHTAVTKEMYSALAKYSPGTASNPEFSGTVGAAWVDGIAIQKAIQLAKPGTNVTSADVLKGFYAFHGETLGGLVGPVTFHKGKVASNHCAFYLGVKDGKFVAPFGTKPICFN
jgi:branched-chain amino acid transport system substrate-binding protein